jgi:serine/threonine-protein kinase
MPPSLVTRFSVPLPEGQGYTNTGRRVLALSPTGRHLVFVAGGYLHVRMLDSLESARIPGSEGISSGAARGPFFSPTGEWVGFWQAGALKKIPVSGGAPTTITKTDNIFGAYWHDDDTIFFAMGPGGVFRVPASGGSAQQIVKLQPGELAQGPQLLSGGEWLLFTLRPRGVRSWDDARVVAQSLRTGERRILVEGGRDGRYFATGHLLHQRAGTVLATAFDVDSMRTRGSAVPVLHDVAEGEGSGVGHFAVSRDGSLAYVRKQALVGSGTPVWVTPDGRQEAPLATGALDRAEQPRLSPDARRMAIIVAGDIWVHDLDGRPPIKLTNEGGVHNPLWTPDGKRLVFERGTYSALQSIATDGSGALSSPLTPVGHYHPHSFTPDGRELLAVRLDAGADTGTDIQRFVVGDGAPVPQPVVRTANSEGFDGASLSPDGRWLAYVSTVTGENEIWAQPYPGPGRAIRISAHGGIEPLWARTGRELYYLEGTRMMRVEVDTRSAFDFKPPTPLFDSSMYTRAQQAPSYDVGPDGRFLMIKGEQRVAFSPIVVVLNWDQELKRLAPVD